jgi:transcriptional regulator with XRE-family HTH domain
MLKKLGSDISIARRKRNLSVEMMCERAVISKQTFQRVESGDPSVSLGALAMCLFALGEEHKLQDLLDVASDDTGLLSDIENLPKRIHRPKPR